MSQYLDLQLQRGAKRGLEEVGLCKMVEVDTGKVGQGFVPRFDPTQISSRPPNAISDSALIVP